MSAAAAMPAPHLFGIEAVDVVLVGDRWFGGVIGRRHEFWRNRRQRCCVRAGAKCCGARNKSKSEFQKITPFHDIISLANVAMTSQRSVMETQSGRCMSRNRTGIQVSRGRMVPMAAG
jgi:hypothetical protein